MTEIEIFEVTLKCQDESPMCAAMIGPPIVEFRTLGDGSSIPLCDYHWHVFQSFNAAIGG